MVDDDGHGPATDLRDVIREPAPVGLENRVPAEGRHPVGDGIQLVEADGATREHEESRSANAAPGQPLQVGFAHAVIHHRHAARDIGAQRRDPAQRAGIVGAVDRRLDDDRPGEPELGADAPVILDAGLRRGLGQGRGCEGLSS